MDITSMIPPMSFGSPNSLQSAVNIALMGKVFDTAENQGQAMEAMMETVAVSTEHMLDRYA